MCCWGLLLPIPHFLVLYWQEGIHYKIECTKQGRDGNWHSLLQAEGQENYSIVIRLMKEEDRFTSRVIAAAVATTAEFLLGSYSSSKWHFGEALSFVEIHQMCL